MQLTFGQKIIISCVFIICIFDCDTVNGSPIVGGEEVTKDDPVLGFVVSLQVKDINNSTDAVTYKHFCGGVLLQVFNETGCIITASHCVSHIKPELISVVIGAKNIANYTGERYENVTVFAQPYNPYTLEGDIAVLTVSIRNSTKIQLYPIRLIIDEETSSRDTCYIYGYGSEELNGPATLQLKIAPVRIISHEMCFEKLGKYNAPEATSGMFCAMGLAAHVDACEGDSGSALLCVRRGRLAIIGVISYGLGCGVIDMPGVYTSVASHLPFICQVLMKL